jgi:hypothetical protein
VAAFCFTLLRSPRVEIALVVVRLDHIASVIVNVNQSIAWRAAITVA